MSVGEVKWMEKSDMNDTVDREIIDQVKTILRRDLKLGATAEIQDDMPLIGGDLDIDSLDILLLISSLEKNFSIKIPSEAVGKWVFQNVTTIAKYVSDNKPLFATVPPAVAVETKDWISRLPHGPEFRYVTSVTEVLPGVSATGIWKVDGNESFFKGHFPGNPIVPGVLLIEAMAQLSGLVSDNQQVRSGKVVHVDVRFDQPIVPPADIHLYSKSIRVMGNLLQCEVSAAIGNQVAASGTITLHLE